MEVVQKIIHGSLSFLVIQHLHHLHLGKCKSRNGRRFTLCPIHGNSVLWHNINGIGNRSCMLIDPFWTKRTNSLNFPNFVLARTGQIRSYGFIRDLLRLGWGRGGFRVGYWWRRRRRLEVLDRVEESGWGNVDSQFLLMDDVVSRTL